MTLRFFAILANRDLMVFTGVTSYLLARIHQHREQTFGGITARYDVKRLVCA